jgi:two-component system chemotaxis response regulator CheB
MAGRDIVVIGASAGGVEALTRVVRGLPSGFPASVFIVCHFPAAARSVLPEILSRAGRLLARHPPDGERLYPGQIYIAPPNHHLLLGPEGRVRLTRGPRENHHRPAIDPLFRTAARYYGPRVIGVILTGALYDGTAGLLAVRAAGGVSVVQDPDDALIAAMPQNAVRVAGADHIVCVADLPALLTRLTHEPVDWDRGDEPMDPIERMPEVAGQDMARQARNERRGQVSVMTCPECGGSLWQVDDPELVRFRCHVGHTYGGEVLLSEQTEALEAALWTAVRTFKEKSVLATQLAHHERDAGNAASAARFEEQAEQAIRFGELIQQHLLGGGPPVDSWRDNPPVDSRRDGPPVQQTTP